MSSSYTIRPGTGASMMRNSVSAAANLDNDKHGFAFALDAAYCIDAPDVAPTGAHVAHGTYAGPNFTNIR